MSEPWEGTSSRFGSGFGAKKFSVMPKGYTRPCDAGQAVFGAKHSDGGGGDRRALHLQEYASAGIGVCLDERGLSVHTCNNRFLHTCTDRPRLADGPGPFCPTHRLANVAGMHYFSAMSTITIPLADEDLTFLRAWSKTQGTSPEAFLAQQARNLRQHLQKPLQPQVAAASGIILQEVAGEEKHREHVEKKHR
jgi:hypothetical protein